MRRVSLLAAVVCGVLGFAHDPLAMRRQDPVVVPSPASPPDVVRQDLNVLSDPAQQVQAFRSQLRNDAIVPSSRSVVLHLGDSHIEAGFFGAAVRTAIGSQVGSAGRGLIVPKYRKRLVNRRGRAYYVRRGLAKPQATRTLEFKVSLGDDEPSGISRLVFFHERGAQFLDWVVVDNTGKVLASVKSAGTGANGPGATTVALAETVRSITVRTQRQKPAQKFAQLYALSLEGAGAGLLYHSYGIVGATADTFVRSPVLPLLASELQPDLVVVSLGTNDARQVPLDDARVRASFGDLVRLVRERAPRAGLVLTTPPGSMRKLTRRGTPVADPGVDLVRRVQLELAAGLPTASWDLFAIMGGPGSIAAWKDRTLAARDLVHFTREGYALQGSLFAQAMLAGVSSTDGR